MQLPHNPGPIRILPRRQNRLDCPHPIGLGWQRLPPLWGIKPVIPARRRATGFACKPAGLEPRVARPFPRPARSRKWNALNSASGICLLSAQTRTVRNRLLFRNVRRPQMSLTLKLSYWLKTPYRVRFAAQTLSIRRTKFYVGRQCISTELYHGR